ncbi:MAG: hypothetical protein Q7R47_04180 [Candidatus Diapherotrites archaeon]|nr:hypothetical protein [Candidatus Diapherotrites archaeon]
MIARGSAMMPVLMWLTVVLVALAASYWYMSRLTADKSDFERLSSDVSALRKLVDAGCDSSYYRVSFNPLTEHGDLNVSTDVICMSSGRLKRCEYPVCPIDLTPAQIGLDAVSELVVTKDATGIVVSSK